MFQCSRMKLSKEDRLLTNTSEETDIHHSRSTTSGSRSKKLTRKKRRLRECGSFQLNGGKCMT